MQKPLSEELKVKTLPSNWQHNCQRGKLLQKFNQIRETGFATDNEELA